MEGKEVKSLLKTARDCIKQKEYKDALKACKAVLKADKDNYNALVFVGVAAEGLEQFEQALAAYRKAIEADETQILAWQGLCNFYEKQGSDVYQTDLIGVYHRLITLSKGDASKVLSIQEKLRVQYEKCGQCQEAFQLVVKMLEQQLASESLWDCLVKLYDKVDSVSQNELNLVKEGFVRILGKTDIDFSEKQYYLEGNLQLMIKMSEDREEILKECLKVRAEYPDSKITLETLALVYLFSLFDKNAVIALELDSLKSWLTESICDQSYQNFVTAVEYISVNKYSDANEAIVEGMKTTDIIPAYLLLAKVKIGMHDYEAAEKAISKGKALLEKKDSCAYGSKNNIKDTLDFYFAKILVLQKRSDSNLLTYILEVIENEVYSTEGMLLKAQYLINESLFEDAQKILDDLENKDPVNVFLCKGLLHLQSDVEQSLNYFEKVLSLDANNFVALLNLGKIHWQKYQVDQSFRDETFSYLLQAAKADPYDSSVFLYLGYFYAQVQNDLVKGKKCFQKSYSLDSKNEEAGIAFVDALNKLKQEHEALQVLQSVTSQAAAGTCKWAWLRLGLYYLQQEDPTRAINSLQQALRADPKDNHCWECLGEAYLKRGSYTAACKSFTKAADLQPDSIYSLYQVATIKLTLGVYPEAVTDYNKILAVSCDYVPALKGLGETRLLQCKAAIREFLNGRAVDYCTEAITNLSRAVYKRPDFSCMWKLLGDCCSVLHVVPSDLCSVSVPSILLGTVQTIEETTTLNKMELLALGSRCYGMAIKCQPDYSPLYCDVGISYYKQALLMKDKFTRKTTMTKAFQALEKSLQLDSSIHKQWNALGLVSLSKEINNKRLAQHCFIKSIKAEQNNVVAWANLGVMYMQCEDIQLAHEAFKVAQSLEPSYVASWIGQALIAETVGQDEEAMDLLRHSTELTPHTESSLGFAHHVCSVLLDSTKANTNWNQYIIEHMYAVTAATDVLAKYTDRIKTNANAYNLYGLLLERQKLYLNCAKAFQTAVDLLQASGSKEEIRKAYLNLARALVYNKEYEKASEIYSTIGDKDMSFEEKCSLALALYHMGDYQKSFMNYNSSVELTDSDSDQSHVYSALGMVQYKMGMNEIGTGDIEGAKTELFKCIQSSCPSVHGLNGLLSLGLIQGDLTLATAAVHELSQFVQPEKSEDFLYMIASLHSLKGEILEGRRCLTKMIHSQPHKASGWRYLVQYLLTHQTQLTSVVSRCCHIGLVADVKNQYQDLSTWLSLSLLGTGQHSRSQAKYNCHSAAQKAVHLHPDNMESWVALISTLYSEMVTQTCLQKKHKLSSALLPLITHFMAKVEGLLSQKEGNTPRLQALHLWCVKQYVVALAATDRVKQAQQFLQQALWLYEEDQILQNLLAFLDQNFNILKINAINDSHGFTRHMLVKLFLAHGLIEEAHETLKMWLPQARTQPRKVLSLVQLGFFAFKQILAGNDTEAFNNVFRESFDECMKINSQVSLFHFMNGMLSVLQNNSKQSKKSLLTCLKYYGEQHKFTYGKSLARKQLLLLSNETDEESIKELISMAEVDKDQDFLTFASQKLDLNKYKSSEV